jgi:PKD repeat protein
VYGPGFYQIDAAADLGGSNGHIIFVNVSYGGCTGNGSVVLDITGPPHTLNVTIYGNLPPFVPDKPSGPTSGYTYAYLVFSTKTTDPDNPADQIRYGWDWDDDNIVDEWTDFYNSGETCNITHIWQQTGTYAVKVKAQDIYGAERGLPWSETFSINITSSPSYHNQKPVASFTYTPTNPVVNDVISFTDTSTDDGAIVKWSWDFGDGTNSTDQNPTHIYTEPGAYTVTLKVTDNKNSEDTEQKILTVSSLPQNITWEKTTQITLRYNKKNKGINYLVWRGLAINASSLAKKILLTDGESISIFSKTEGAWLTYTVGASDQLDFQISLWDIIIIQTRSEKTITVDTSQQNISMRSVTIDFAYEAATKKGNMGYNFFAWTSNITMLIKDFVETYGFSKDDVSISLYDPDTSSWNTYNPSLPAVFNTQFTIQPYSILCIKVAKDSQERVLVIT